MVFIVLVTQSHDPLRVKSLLILQAQQIPRFRAMNLGFSCSNMMPNCTPIARHTRTQPRKTLEGAKTLNAKQRAVIIS